MTYTQSKHGQLSVLQKMDVLFFAPDQQGREGGAGTGGLFKDFKGF